MANPVVVEATRGALVESAHRGAGAVVDADGRVVMAFGDADRPVYPRSAVKAFQALPLVASAGPAPVPAFKAEKCFGIAVAGENDCQTATHSCAGESKLSRDKESWIYVPAGTCAKIDGGSLKRA